jgi:hypothetical protein
MFKSYRRKGITEMRPYVPGEDITGVSMSNVDREAGCPKEGDYIARNPDNHNDRWLVNATYFAKQQYEEVPELVAGQTTADNFGDVLSL